MKKILTSLIVVVMTVVGLVLLGSPAEAAPARWTLSEPLARETVRPGDVDVNPYAIEHVYEVQYRLQRLGLLTDRPDGRFGPRTKAAVMRFQQRRGLRPTGVVNHRTWPLLIRSTIRGRAQIPRACMRPGWHACYDRLHHQVNLYRSGTLHNSWLVRGGGITTVTRTGDFIVFSRDIDHYSHQFDNAPMPYSQFFSGGEALHGSRFMVDPFEGHSHGCINMWVEDSRQLWNLTADKLLHVHVYGAWN